MDIVRNVDRIRRYGRIAQVVGILGFAAFGVSIIFLVRDLLGIEGSTGPQLVAIGATFLLVQVSTYLANEYLRQPRQDEVLDDALRKVVNEGRL